MRPPKTPKNGINQEDNSRGVGGSGSSDVTGPPVASSSSSGSGFSGVMGGGEFSAGSTGSCEVPPHC